MVRVVTVELKLDLNDELADFDALALFIA